MKLPTAPALLLLCLAASALRAAPGEPLIPEVAAWIQAQAKYRTWSAEFMQTRSLKSLTQPLTSTGRVWFSAPPDFRWELGSPAQTIAVRSGDALRVIYPKLSVVEVYPLGKDSAGPWRDALSLLEAGFPTSREELLRQYAVLSQGVTNGIARVRLQPRAAAARRMIPEIQIAFNLQQAALLSTELAFADGSRMKNDFINPVVDPVLDPKLFQPVIPGDYRVVQPLDDSGKTSGGKRGKK
jgi:outer membrane lipoprotein-sorting protein